MGNAGLNRASIWPPEGYTMPCDRDVIIRFSREMARFLARRRTISGENPYRSEIDKKRQRGTVPFSLT